MGNLEHGGSLPGTASLMIMKENMSGSIFINGYNGGEHFWNDFNILKWDVLQQE
jgi:hypothetical protein